MSTCGSFFIFLITKSEINSSTPNNAKALPFLLSLPKEKVAMFTLASPNTVPSAPI